MHSEFDAMELHRDGSLERASWSLEGDVESGWSVRRAGAPVVELGPGYCLLDVVSCGVCATDLARPLMPFPLPQVVGHEVLARDAEGREYVLEINASCYSRGVPLDDCPACSTGLQTHCPRRTVLGIDRLPGGFGAAVLAPRLALVPVPDLVPGDTAVLAEPFAAALHAACSLDLADGDVVAVLGPRRLGMLVIAALDALRRRKGTRYSIEAWVRRGGLEDLARTLGADEVRDLSRAPLPRVDVVVDCTGNPDGLAAAVELARREVHLKSTHGRPAAGLDHLTELVVDELGIARLDRETVIEPPRAMGGRPHVTWLARTPVPAWLTAAADVACAADAGEASAALEPRGGPGRWPRSDAVVVDDDARLAAAIRPAPDDARSLVRPRGKILLAPSRRFRSPLTRAVLERGLAVTSSRCGDFVTAMTWMQEDPGLRDLGRLLVTHRFPRMQLGEAFEVAASPDAIKVVVENRDAPARPGGGAS